MATIELKDICHSYKLGSFQEQDAAAIEAKDNDFVVKHFNITWQEGSANALLGPSGCGKTTILSIISGLLQPTMGKITLDGHNVTALPPEQRRIPQIFQFPVVYDTISVYKNLAFPLKNAGAASKYIKRRVKEIAEILELTHLLKTSAGRITQAEKQKVSLGRGIVREDTAAILLDEPLTVIDPKEKYILRRKLREVQRTLQITMVYVTHDQHEALTFADHITVMKDGEIVQTGTPEQLHDEPESPFIGYFIGIPGMNVMECTLTDQGLDCGEFTIGISETLRATLTPHGPGFTLGIRPEFVKPTTQANAELVAMKVGVIERMGAFKILNMGVNGKRLKSRVPESLRVAEGNQVWLRFPEEQMKIFKDEQRVY